MEISGVVDSFFSSFYCTLNLKPTATHTHTLFCERAVCDTEYWCFHSHCSMWQWSCFTLTLCACVVTCLWCRDVDDYTSSWCWAQVRHSILALHGEAVIWVRLQVGDQHGGRWEAELSRNKMDAAAARRALPAVTGAFPAVEAVGDVPSASWVSGRRPLQGDAGFIHRGDGVLWSSWRTWGSRKTDI